MCSAPSNVPLVDRRALIAPVSYVQWLLEAVGGLSIPHRARGVKASGFTFTVPVSLPSPSPLKLRCAPDDLSSLTPKYEVRLRFNLRAATMTVRFISPSRSR